MQKRCSQGDYLLLPISQCGCGDRPMLVRRKYISSNTYRSSGFVWVRWEDATGLSLTVSQEFWGDFGAFTFLALPMMKK